MVAPPLRRHLRVRRQGVAQPVTTVELFFDLVYVFAITQLTQLILHELTLSAMARAAFLLLVVWWAWICTTWMANWFDPHSPAVGALLTGVMLVSLLMAAGIPRAFGADGALFAGSFVTLQVGRSVAAASLLRKDHPLRDVFRRVAAWSIAGGVLWLGGAALDGDTRLLLWAPALLVEFWAPALLVEFCAPVAGYWLPGRGRAATTDWDIEGGHFTERCEAFTIIALGESIVLTGATAAHVGLNAMVSLSLSVAFLETAALWWLYFGATAERARDAMRTCEDPGRLARDAYTYLHVPIVAGIIAVSVGNDLLVAGPNDAAHGVGLAVMLGGPVLFLVGESLFRMRLIGDPANTKRLAAAALLLLITPVGARVTALALSITVAVLLIGLALWELAPTARRTWNGQSQHEGVSPRESWSLVVQDASAAT